MEGFVFCFALGVQSSKMQLQSSTVSNTFGKKTSYFQNFKRKTREKFKKLKKNQLENFLKITIFFNMSHSSFSTNITVLKLFHARVTYRRTLSLLQQSVKNKMKMFPEIASAE
jgi:hypothetical protein